MNCTSASDMRFRNTGRAFSLCILMFFSLQFSGVSHAELVDRTVAFVDDTALTLSELNEAFDRAVKIKKNITKKEVLNTMINRVLLISEARRLRIEAGTDEELVNEYIDVKIRAFVRIREEDAEDYYKKNLQEFKDAGFEAVREKIEEYLLEKEVNNVLKKHLSELREKSYIKILMEGP